MDPTETCASCQKPLSDPKTLPCLHYLCTHCIEALVKKQNDAKKTKEEEDQKNKNKNKPSATTVEDGDMCCPQCSTVFVIPAGGVAALSADSYVLGVAKQKESASKVNPNDVKCVCEEEPATVHCASCDLFIGERCQKGHKASKAKASHVVVKVDDYFKGSGPTTRVLFCQHHPGSEINTFCQTDDQPMCAQCAVSSH